MMDPDLARRAAEVFEAALDVEFERRASFLDAACAGRPALRAEVESLMALHTRGKRFLDSGVPSPGGDDSGWRGNARPESVDRVSPGSRLGPYEIIAPLGAGGMGEVYRARDTRLGREVAVKVLPELLADDPDRRARFEREAQAVAAISHPSILAIHDYGTHGDIPYAVMELLEGETIRDRLATGPLLWREAVELGAVIAEGLAAAHSRGIVHRDLKPENLFQSTDGLVKILDFGLARVTRSRPVSRNGSRMAAETEAGAVLGTVGYMSPEQVRGEPVDARSDIFSFGCVLYEMVTGRRAFQRETAAETMAAILYEEAPDPSTSGTPCPAEVGRIIRDCLVKNRNQRLHSGRDLALRLRAALGNPSMRPASRRLRRGRPLIAVSVTAALTAGVIAASVYYRMGGVDPSRTGGSPRAPPEIEAVAVLPFENVGGAPESEPLSEGLAEYLIDSLGQVRRRDFKVRPFTSVSRYGRESSDVRTMGRELNVQVIVTGTLRRKGDDISIGVEIVDAREDNLLWSRRYSGKLGGILELQDRMALDVATELRLSLTGEEERLLTRRYTQNPEAYLLFREGRFHGNTFKPDRIEVAKRCFEQALERDPDYAPALAGIGTCYVLWGAMHLGPQKTYQVARTYLLRALEIDESLADPHAGLAAVHLFYDWDWRAAERQSKRALALGSSTAMYGFYLAAHGRLAEALATLRQGQELEPLAPARRNELAMCYTWMRDYDQSIVWARKALQLEPGFMLAYGGLGLAYAQNGMYEDAIRELQKGLTVSEGHPYVRGMLGYTYAKAGRSPEARDVLRELTAAPQRRFRDAFALAEIHAALGEKDAAFHWLQEACNERDPSVIWLKVDPTMDNLRADPRFTRTLEDMRLPP